MKKNIAKLLVLVIAISLFSGCANKNKIGDELKTIKLWSGYCMIAEDELEMEKSEWILTKLVDKYNEIQDDIRVEFSYFDDDDVMGIGDLADTYYTYGPQLITGEISPSHYAELLDQANQ